MNITMRSTPITPVITLVFPAKMAPVILIKWAEMMHAGDKIRFGSGSCLFFCVCVCVWCMPLITVTHAYVYISQHPPLCCSHLRHTIQEEKLLSHQPYGNSNSRKFGKQILHSVVVQLLQK